MLSVVAELTRPEHYYRCRAQTFKPVSCYGVKFGITVGVWHLLASIPQWGPCATASIATCTATSTSTAIVTATVATATLATVTSAATVAATATHGSLIRRCPTLSLASPFRSVQRLINGIRTAYSWENGFTNPRLLYPSIQPLLSDWKLRINGPVGMEIVPESAILRQSLAHVRCEWFGRGSGAE